MPKMSRTAEIRAPTDVVFAYLDDINNIGTHMSSRSMAMMGGRLDVETLTESRTGKGAAYRLTGKVLWIPIDVTETVTEWIKDREKRWHTVGEQKMIVMSRYEMHFVLTPTKNGWTHVFFEIEYNLPNSLLASLIGRLLAQKYADWCLRRVTEDARTR